MELRHLRYFVAIVQEGSFTKAARKLHVAQPALSVQIRQLEEELGVKLFERTASKAQLTYAGGVFYEHVQKVFQSLHDALWNTELAAKGYAGRLRVGALNAAARLFFPKVMPAFKKKFPDVFVSFVELSTEEQVQALWERKIDLGIGRKFDTTLKITSLKIASDYAKIAVWREHPLAQKNNVSLCDIAHEPFIMFPREKNVSMYNQILEACYRAGFVPRVVQETSQLHTAACLVAAGLGVAILPQSTLEIPIENLCALSFKETFDFGFYAHFVHEHPVGAIFLEELKKITCL